MQIKLIKGDTWNGKQFQITKNGNPIDLTGAYIKSDWVNRCNRRVRYSYNLQITDAVNGKFAFLPFIVSIENGDYDFDVQINFNNGVIKTYIKGIVSVIADITI